MVAAATELVRKCEKDLRALVVAAAERGDYSDVLRITAWAKMLASLLVDASSKEDSAAAGDTGWSQSQREFTLRVDGVRNQDIEGPGKYPRFVRHGSDLIKIGWSKHEGAEYEHKAPYQTLEFLLSAMEGKAAGRKVFPTESFLPLADPRNGSQIPDYQVYVCLGWLRQLGIIDQHGRKGYSVLMSAGLRETVQAAWEKLDEWAGTGKK